MKKANIGLMLALSLLLPIFSGANPASARGGFGGGGRSFGGGGGFGGGDRGFGGDRSFGDRGFDGFRDDGFRGGDGGMRSDFARDFDRGFDHPFDNGDIGRADRPDAFNNSDFHRVDPMDSGTRNYGTQRNLASDGGYGSIMRSAGGAGYARPTMRMSSAALGNQARLVRNGFNNYGAFRGNWWHDHPNAWWRRDWDDRWPWRWGTWGEFAPWWGCALGVLPVYYDYGDNITYDDNGYVDYGGSPVVSAGDYYQEAQDLATSGDSDGDFGESAAPVSTPPPVSGGPQNSNPVAGEAEKLAHSGGGEWKPFGVYSLVQGGQSNSTTLFQLCSNKRGQIRGNYFNGLTNDTEPVTGSIDKKNMRAAWTVGKDKKVVYDTGVANLLKDESPILIHFGKDSTQQWTLVRIKNPNDSTSKGKA